MIQSLDRETLAITGFQRETSLCKNITIFFSSLISKINASFFRKCPKIPPAQVLKNGQRYFFIKFKSQKSPIKMPFFIAVFYYIKNQKSRRQSSRRAPVNPSKIKVFSDS